jgi:DNA-binding transcriptional LysR family regulator
MSGKLEQQECDRNDPDWIEFPVVQPIRPRPQTSANMPVNSVNLKLLHTFLLAAELGSFRLAAEGTHRSPSAISMQIRDLEIQIGLPLFVRTPRKIILTPEGHILYEQVRRAISEVQLGLDQLADAALSRRGHVKVACAPSLAAARLPNILATFRIRHPRSIVEVRELSSDRLLNALREQAVDFAIAPHMGDTADFEFDPVLIDPFYACVPPIFDDGTDVITLKAIAGKPCILLSRTTVTRAILDRATAALGLILDVQYEVEQVATAISLASAGLGIAIIPRIALGHGGGPQFRAVPISDTSAIRHIGIMTLRGQVPHTFAEQLISLIRANLNQQ